MIDWYTAISRHIFTLAYNYIASELDITKKYVFDV